MLAASSRFLLFGAITALAVLLGVGVGTYVLSPKGPAIDGGTMLPQPRPVVDFKLTGEDGKPYTDADLKGHWTIVFAGYTHCPDVCPTTLQTLKAVKADLGADAGKLGVLFISVDPARDTPETLGHYVHFFGPDFRGATGSDEQLEALGKNLGFVFVKVPGPTPDSYTMDHSAALMLINPQAQLAGYLLPPFDAQTIAKDMKTLMDGAA